MINPTALKLVDASGPPDAPIKAANRPQDQATDFKAKLKQIASNSSEELRDAATKLVSSALILPVLSSMHESPLRPKDGPFAASSIEKRFGPLLDQQFADRITSSSNFSLIDSIVKRFPQSGAGGKGGLDARA